MLAGVLPTPAVALLALDLGVVISASHNPPEYNGVKFFDRDGNKLTDASEEEIEALLDAPPTPRRRRSIDRVERRRRTATSSTSSSASAPTSPASGSRSTARTAPTPEIAPEAFEQPRRRGDRDRRRPRTGEHQRRLRRDRPRAAPGDRPRRRARPRRRLRRRRRPDARRRRRRRTRSTATRSSPILALHLGVDVVAVTVMTNLGFHRLMEERGIRVVTTDVGDRYVLEALRRESGDPRRRAVRPRDLPARPRHGRRARRGAAPLQRDRGHDARRGRRP